MDKKIKKNILKGSAATSIGTISGMIFQFLTIMILTRVVSKDELGIYLLVMVIVNMFNLLGGLGVRITMVKFIASDNIEERQDVLLPVLLLRAFGSIMFSIIFIITARYILHYFDDRIYQYTLYLLAIFILASFRDLFYSLMQGLYQFKQYSIVNVTSSIFRVVLVLIFMSLTKLDIKILLIIEVLATLQPLLHQVFVIPFGKYIKVKPTLNTFKRIIKFSIPLYLNNLLVFLNGQAHVFIIGLYLNPASIANFSVASKVPVALIKIFRSFIVVYFPNLAKLFSAGDKKTAINLIEKSLGVFSILTTLMVLFAFFFRSELTVLIFSSKYEEISLAFALLILRFFMRGISALIGYPFIPAGYPSVPTKINSVASLISIGLSFLMVPVYGYMGAVYALLILNIISSALYILASRRYEINPKVKCFLKPTVLFLAIPISFLFTGEISFWVNLILFIICLVIGWIISDEFKSVMKFVFSFLREHTLQKHSA
jgi:O-antigen/teichoic acid export membrane protein